MVTNAQKEGAFQAHTTKVIGRINYIVFSISVLEQSRAKLIGWEIRTTKKNIQVLQINFLKDYGLFVFNIPFLFFEFFDKLKKNSISQTIFKMIMHRKSPK